MNKHMVALYTDNNLQRRYRRYIADLEERGVVTSLTYEEWLEWKQ